MNSNQDPVTESTLTIRQFAVPLLLCAAAAMCAVYAASTMEVRGLRMHLADWTALALALSFACVVLGLGMGFRQIRPLFSPISSKAKKSFLIIVVCAVLILRLVPVETNRMFFDEHIYQGVAQSLALNGSAVLCDFAEVGYGTINCQNQNYNKQPNGSPFWTSLFFRLLGVSEASAHIASNAAYVLGVLAVFAVGWLYFASEAAALFSALIYALTPMVLIWSRTTSSEPLAAALAASGMAAAAILFKAPSFGTALLFSGTVGMAVHVRPESILLLLPIVMYLLLNHRDELLKPRLYWTGLLTSLFVLVELLHLYSVRMENWGSRESRFSGEIFLKNIWVNLPFYFTNNRFPVCFGILAVIGVAFGGRWRARVPVIVWLAWSAGIFLFFYAGSYDYGADVRFSVISAPVVAILAGLGCRAVIDTSFFPAIQGQRRSIALVVICLLNAFTFAPLCRAATFEAWSSREDVETFRGYRNLIPRDSLVLTHVPGMWTVWGFSAAQTFMGSPPSAEALKNAFSHYKGGIYLHYGFWCNVSDPRQTGLCTGALEYYPHTLLAQRTIWSSTFALYRLYPPGSAVPASAGISSEHQPG